MPTYNLGTLTVVDHGADKITDALGIPEYRFDDLFDLAAKAWTDTPTISEGIEYIAQRVNGSEFALTLTIFGRKWEEEKQKEAREESGGPRQGKS